MKRGPVQRFAAWLHGRVNPPQSRTYYAGAAVNRLTADFLKAGSSGTQEVRADLATLRMRARQLCRDNPNARRYLAILSDNVVGPDGLLLQARTENARGQLHEELNRQIEQAWKSWSKPAHCTVDGRTSWPMLQSQIVQTVARDGECFVRMVRGFPNRFGFALQLLDAELCDETYDRPARPGEPEIRNGVEVDGWGRPTGYWLWTAHPDDYGKPRVRQRFAAEDVLHITITDRMGQVRGLSWFAPVLLPLQMLYGYTEAELTAARTAAAKMGFITQSPETPGLDLGQTEPTAMEAAPGVIDRLAVGEQFTAWDPTHPSGNFGPFLTTILHQIASGLNVSHASLTGDLSQVNYSSIRAGMLAERDRWRALQTWFADHVCDPVFAAWFPMATLSPELTVPSTDMRRYEAREWQARGWDWVDPQKDIEAQASALAYGFTTRRAILAANGLDFEQTITDTKAEREFLEAQGVEFASPKSAPAPADAPSPGETESTPTDTSEDQTEDRGGRPRLRAVRSAPR